MHVAITATSSVAQRCADASNSGAACGMVMALPGAVVDPRSLQTSSRLSSVSYPASSSVWVPDAFCATAGTTALRRRGVVPCRQSVHPDTALHHRAMA